LYHCEFPSAYLSNLRLTGKPGDEKVHFKRSKGYKMTDSKDRVEFLEHFVALAQYLVSGESKVGWLWDSPPETGRRSRIHRRVIPCFCTANIQTKEDDSEVPI